MARDARRMPRARKSRTGVWYDRTRIGTLVRATDGGISFTYDSAWLNDERAFPVASVLPLDRAGWRGDPVIAAFDNLLPDAEGELRAKIAERIGAAGADIYSLLSVLGRDCVGALQFLPDGEQPGGQDMDYREISEEEMLADLGNLAAAPLAQGDDDDFRISIAGAQEKTAYLFIDGRWAKPRGITPTSHIFKTPMGILPGPDEVDLSDSVENELLCMTLASEIGLPTATVEKIVLPGQVALAVERFDRRWDSGTLKRLPQEDICQSLGYPSARKYQKVGGPGIRQIMDLLRESDDPVTDRETFFRAQIFFYLIGASDGHAKNFSLRLGRRGRFRLAPLYDILSLAPVIHAGRLQRKRYRLAMSVDGHYGIDEMVPRHFENEGRASGLPANRPLELLSDMIERLGPAIERTRDKLRDTVAPSIAEPIALDANERADQGRHRPRVRSDLAKMSRSLDAQCPGRSPLGSDQWRLNGSLSRGQHTVVVAAIRQAFDQPDRAHASETWRKVAEQLRPRWPKLADLMDRAMETPLVRVTMARSEHDVLAYMSFPRQHRTKLHSTNPIERLNKEVKRRADVVGIFPNKASIMRLIGAMLFEQNDEWQTSSRYIMVEAFAQIDKEEIDPILSITTKAA